MSRIRTVKPEFWTSEQVMACSPHARLLFIGLWNFCDDHGVHPASYVRLKAEIFPADSFTTDDIKRWIGELILNDLVREYAVGNKVYWIVTGWKQHQRIDKPTFRHPLPLSELKTIGDSTTARQEVVDNSITSLGIVEESSPTDRNGMESKGKDKNIGEVETSPSVASESVQEVFKHWQTVMNRPRAKLDQKRCNKLRQALKLGYTAEELKKAIDGCALTPFNQGQNDRGQRYDDLELILRDAPHIDRFISNADNPPFSHGQGGSSTEFMTGAI
jgi:hypothetical protein